MIILYKYNQFKKTGWIEDGYNKDLEIEVNLTSPAISILSNLFSITEEDDLSEFSGYVHNCYNSLNSNDFYDKNKCFTYVEQAYIATKELSDKLNSMTSIIKRYTNNILSKEQFKANDIAKNVCEFYRKRWYITFKQRKLLLHIFFDCYEGKTQKEDIGYYFAQVED